MIKSVFVFLLLVVVSACTQQVLDDKNQPEATVIQVLPKEESLTTAQSLKDTTLTILWREDVFDSISNNTFSTIVLNDNYLKTISDPEKAVVGFVSTFVGSECDWDGEPNAEMSNLDCKLTKALGLGYQCSDKHQRYLERWFRESPEALIILKNCYAVPFTATAQNTLSNLALTIKEDLIKVNFDASGMNMREESVWEWSEELVFKVSHDKLELVSQIKTK